MLPDYIEHWGLHRVPFALTPDPAMLYLTNQHRECLLRLKYAIISGKGGALLVSENAGDGKTSILYRLIEDLEREFEGRSRVAFISHPTLEPREMLQEICTQLGGEVHGGGKLEALGSLQQRLEDLHADGQKVVVMVDEGQMLVHRPDILQELRIMLNFTAAEHFLLTFVFSGQAPLEPAIRAMPEFWQRLPVRYFLRNLDAGETADLVRHRLEVAGAGDREIFDDDACQVLHRYSRGCPRVICSLADLCLVIGHSQRARVIGAEQGQLAAVDMGLAEGERGGFHYFHFVRGQLQGIADRPEGKRSARRRRARFRSPSPAPEPRPPAPAPSAAAFQGGGRTGPAVAPTGLITCPGCQEKAPPDLDACPVCHRRLSSPCGECGRPHRPDAEVCTTCGGAVIPEEEALGELLRRGIQAARLHGGVPARLPCSYRREPGEQLLHLIRPRGRLTMEAAGQQAGPGPAWLLITSRGLSLLMRRSYVRLPYARLGVECVGDADAGAQGSVLQLRLGGRHRYRLTLPGSAATPFARTLQEFVTGTQALHLESEAADVR